MSDNIRKVHQQWSFLHAMYRLVDAACIFASLAIALEYAPESDSAHWLVVGASTVIVHRMVAELTGMYRSWRGVPLAREVACVLLTWGYALPVLLGAAYLTGYSGHFTRTSVVIWALITPCMITVARFLRRKLLSAVRARGLNMRRYAVCGINELGVQLAANIDESPEMGLELVGFYDDRPAERTVAVPQKFGSKLGDIDDLVAHARRGSVDLIYITFPMRAEERIRKVLERLGDTTASVYIVPDFFVFELLHARWTNIGGVPVVSVFENPLYGVDGLLKRAVDVSVGACVFALAAVPMLLIAVAVKLSSRGPVLFKQRRYGLDGEEIRVWKFRTMTVCEDGDAVKQAQRDDDRVTPVGRFLRATSLDELPQIFNVLAGSMSLVGPRPHATAHNEAYRSLIRGYMLRHKVKPGITGLAQVRGFRGETETLDKMEKRVACDHQYIRNWSLWLDLKILFETLFVVFSRKNAY
jgi:putative colanic acid biosynthesis UDP-glucose lipid carrier transferase